MLYDDAELLHNPWNSTQDKQDANFQSTDSECELEPETEPVIKFPNTKLDLQHSLTHQQAGTCNWSVISNHQCASSLSSSPKSVMVISEDEFFTSKDDYGSINTTSTHESGGLKRDKTTSDTSELDGSNVIDTDSDSMISDYQTTDDGFSILSAPL